MLTLRNKKAWASEEPLCVDLDGTLILTDLLVESFLALLKQNPLSVFLIPFWLMKGKAYLKKKIARRADIDPGTLPYCEPFVHYLQQQKAKGRMLVLATAADSKYANAISNHLGLFDQVLASDGGVNLSGAKKAEALRRVFPDKRFAYAGNAREDVDVWEHAADAILVNPTAGLRRDLAGKISFSQVFGGRSGRLRAYVRALRPHQWAKNILVFVPLLASHNVSSLVLLGRCGLAFVAFSLCASSAYVLNDLLDLPSDRLHPTKKNRPFAAARVPVLHGIAMCPILLAMACAVAAFLPVQFGLLLALYYVTTLAYSFRLKQTVLLDVLTLGGLYTLRIQAGAAAIGIESSFWLLALSVFFFMSLALLKRYTELRTKLSSPSMKAHGRGYDALDIETLSQFGISSGFASVVILALYVNSDQVTLLYHHPQLIWLICPIALYWISRIWIMGRRGQVNEDPVVFALRDVRTHILGILAAGIMWAATLP